MPFRIGPRSDSGHFLWVRVRSLQMCDGCVMCGGGAHDFTPQSSGAS